MWNGAYHYKLVDRWTPALYWAPRWFAGNAYPNILDHVPAPPASAWSGTLPSPPGAPDPGRMSVGAYNDQAAIYTPTTSGSLFQSLFEIFAAEFEYLKVHLINAHLIGSRTYDVAEPECCWLATFDRPITKIEISLLNDTWVEIPQAPSLQDLFFPTRWSWYPSENSAIITGLHVVDYQTEQRVDDWHFYPLPLTPNGDFSERTSVFHLLHPGSKQWMPIHPLNVRSDGWMGYMSDDSTRVRVRQPARELGSWRVLVRINGEVETSVKTIQPWNSLDERGLWLGLPRYENRFPYASETNEHYANHLFILAQSQGQTRSRTTISLATHFREASYSTLTTSTSSFVASTTNPEGYLIVGLPQYIYVKENLTRDVDTPNLWRSRYAIPEQGCWTQNGGLAQHFTVSSTGSVFGIDRASDNRIHTVESTWKLKLWEHTDQLRLTSNFPMNVEQITYVTAARVRIEDPSNSTLRTSFKRTSPRLKWSRQSGVQDVVTGIAVFA